MKNKGQSGVVIVVILIIAVGVFFLYHEGYFNLNVSKAPTTTTVNPYLPISLNISSTNDLSQLYTGQNITVISTVGNSGDRPVSVTLSPYGCSFLPIITRNVSIPASSPASISWGFSGSTPVTCSITFLACFNAVSYTNYPVTIRSYEFTGTAPTSGTTSSSGLPVSIELESFNTTVVAGPSSQNTTEYANGVSLTSTGSTSELNWLSVSIKNGQGYFTNSLGVVNNIDPSINITPQEYPLTFQNGRLLAPVAFLFLVNPVSNSLGYTVGTDINVSAGYTYCITSNSIPITLHSS